MATAHSPYLPSAPARLVHLHRERKVTNGRALLERLVTGSSLGTGARNDLTKAWTSLDEELGTDAKCDRLWGEITYLYRQSRCSPLSAAKRKSELEAIASLARTLRKKVDGDGDLDSLIHGYFDPESMLINGIPDWGRLDSTDRARAAAPLLVVWPSLVEVLEELERRATGLADSSSIKRRARQPTRRVDSAAYFAVQLSGYFRTTAGRPHHAAVVALTQAAFKRMLEPNFAKKAEENARRGA